MEKYVRVKVSDGDITSTVIIPESELQVWLSRVEGYIKNGISVSFSVAKKSSVIKIKP